MSFFAYHCTSCTALSTSTQMLTINMLEAGACKVWNGWRKKRRFLELNGNADWIFILLEKVIVMSMSWGWDPDPCGSHITRKCCTNCWQDRDARTLQGHWLPMAGTVWTWPKPLHPEIYFFGMTTLQLSFTDEISHSGLLRAYQCPMKLLLYYYAGKATSCVKRPWEASSFIYYFLRWGRRRGKLRVKNNPMLSQWHQASSVLNFDLSQSTLCANDSFFFWITCLHFVSYNYENSQICACDGTWIKFS